MIPLGVPWCLVLACLGGYFFIRKTIYHMEDFKLFGLEWQRRVIEKNLEVLKHAEI